LKSGRAPGFSLLEVMIAMAIMGLSLVYLFHAQARSMQLAAKGRALNIATQLARKQLVDCEFDLLKKGFAISDYESEGNFEKEGYKDYLWECHGLRFNMPAPSPEAIQKAIKSQTKAMSQGPESMGADFATSALAPFFGLVSNTLGDSIRELVVIIRWKEAEIDEELKVVTHVTDPRPLSELAGILQQQAGAFGGGGG